MTHTLRSLGTGRSAFTRFTHGSRTTWGADYAHVTLFTLVTLLRRSDTATRVTNISRLAERTCDSSKFVNKSFSKA